MFGAVNPRLRIASKFLLKKMDLRIVNIYLVTLKYTMDNIMKYLVVNQLHILVVESLPKSMVLRLFHLQIKPHQITHVAQIITESTLQT